MGSARHLCFAKRWWPEPGVVSTGSHCPLSPLLGALRREARKRPGWYCSYWRDQMSHEERICCIYLYLDPPKIYRVCFLKIIPIQDFFLSWEIKAMKKTMWVGKSYSLRPPQVLAPSGARKGGLWLLLVTTCLYRKPVPCGPSAARSGNLRGTTQQHLPSPVHCGVFLFIPFLSSFKTC